MKKLEIISFALIVSCFIGIGCLILMQPMWGDYHDGYEKGLMANKPLIDDILWKMRVHPSDRNVFEFSCPVGDYVTDPFGNTDFTKCDLNMY